MKEVLVVDDEQQVLIAVNETLKRRGYAVTTAGNGVEATRKINEHFFQAVITDVKMPELDGMQLLQEVKRISPATPVILLTGHGTVSDAVRALKEGAFDYLIKPFSAEQLLEVVRKATRDGVEDPESLSQKIVTAHKGMKEVLSMASQAALSEATILIEAESGTGKELIARHIHFYSPRRKGPFVAVNCAAVPEELLESELFGHEKGAFTGALQRKPGKFELAQGGTLLLDEIGEMAPLLQAKLLRVLQEKEVDPVGAVRPLAIDVRVIATTNRDLRKAVEAGHFREDLFYRLNVIPLFIPPLRERKEDIHLLVRHFCEKFGSREEARTFRDDTLEMLNRYDWPGNVRELENLVRRVLALCRNTVITPSDLFTQFPTRHGDGVELKPGLSLREMEKEMIGVTLKKTSGNRTQAAEMLGISLRTLRNKLREYRSQGDLW